MCSKIKNNNFSYKVLQAPYWRKEFMISLVYAQADLGLSWKHELKAVFSQVQAYKTTS